MMILITDKNIILQTKMRIVLIIEKALAKKVVKQY
jgi:hypothetical protein